MDSEIVIRKGCDEDIEAMALLLEELFTIEDDFTVNRERQIKGLQMLLESSDADLWVAEYDGGVIGMVSMQRLVSTAVGGSVGLIEDLVITQSYRGKGIGSRLLDTLIRESERKGYARLSLGADSRNAPALSFYRDRGFVSGHLHLMYRM